MLNISPIGQLVNPTLSACPVPWSVLRASDRTTTEDLQLPPLLALGNTCGASKTAGEILENEKRFLRFLGRCQWLIIFIKAEVLALHWSLLVWLSYF